MTDNLELYVHYRPEGGLPKQIKQRKATDAELVGVVRHLPNVEEVEWCAEHGDMSAGLYGFRLDAYTCWAFTQIDWSLHPDATDCDFIDVAVVPLGGDDT